MSEEVHCDTHGESEEAYVCGHLLGEGTGLGFNRNDPTADNPFPDAWCDNCEIIRAAHGGWNSRSEKLRSVSLLCSGCYERARIGNVQPSRWLIWRVCAGSVPTAMNGTAGRASISDSLLPLIGTAILLDRKDPSSMRMFAPLKTGISSCEA